MRISDWSSDVCSSDLVELSVVPRGKLLWTDDGSNAKEGKSYEGPFRIADGEITLSVFAEDGDVTATRNFRIAPDVGGKTEIDPHLPVIVRGRVRFATAAEVFSFLGEQAVKRADQIGRAHV